MLSTFLVYIHIQRIRDAEKKDGSTEKGNRVNNYLKDGVDVSPERTSEYLDAVEAVQKGEKGAAERADIQTEIDEVRRLRDMFESAFAKSADNVKTAQAEQAYNVNSDKNLEFNTNEDYNENISHSLKKTPYNEYNTIGMKWAYGSSTQI